MMKGNYVEKKQQKTIRKTGSQEMVAPASENIEIVKTKVSVVGRLCFKVLSGNVADNLVSEPEKLQKSFKIKIGNKEHVSEKDVEGVKFTEGLSINIDSDLVEQVF